MMISKQEPISILERIRLTYRGFQVFGKANPGLNLSVFLVSLVKGVSPYVTIYFSARLISALSTGASSREIWLRTLWLVLAVTLMAVLTSLTEHFNGLSEGNVYWTNRFIYGKKLLSLDFPAVNNPELTETRRLIENDSNQYGYGFFNLRKYMEKGLTGLTSILSSVALTVSFFQHEVSPENPSLLFLNSPWILILVILSVLLASYFASLLAHNNEKFREKNVHVLHRYVFGHTFWYIQSTENKNGIPMENRIYRIDQYLSQSFDELLSIRENSILRKHAKGIGGIASALSSALLTLFMGIAYVLVCLKAYGGAFDIGYVSQYVGALTALTGGLTMFGEALSSFYTNAAFLKRIFDYLDVPNDLYQGSLTTEKRSDKQYDIEFKDVSFRYPGTEEWVLRHVNVHFKVGERLALVGRNGSGKTTFVKLLCRLYDPDEGDILLNGISIRKYRMEDYQKLFSVVFQDYQLLDVSIAENVSASSHYDEEKVTDVLEKVAFSDRAASMDKGIHTYIGTEFDENGIRLSGGESQKIAIARALYKDAAFLVMDEPTASLDPIAEAEIYQHLDEIAEDKTALYISHRLSTCRFCDEILVFAGGEIVQRGSHEQLLENPDSEYARLWNAQAKYYQPETANT